MRATADGFRKGFRISLVIAVSMLAPTLAVAQPSIQDSLSPLTQSVEVSPGTLIRLAGPGADSLWGISSVEGFLVGIDDTGLRFEDRWGAEHAVGLDDSVRVEVAEHVERHAKVGFAIGAAVGGALGLLYVHSRDDSPAERGCREYTVPYSEYSPYGVQTRTRCDRERGGGGVAYALALGGPVLGALIGHAVVSVKWRGPAPLGELRLVAAASPPQR